MDKPNFSYWLNVEGSREDQEKVYQLLGTIEDTYWGCPILNKVLEPSDLESKTPYATYSVPEKYGTIMAWDEDSIDQLFHAIALQVPEASLELEGINEEDHSYGFQVRFFGDLYEKVYKRTQLPDYRTEAGVPFDQRHNPNIYEEKQQKVMYVLYEVYEAGDAPRQFNILAMSEDKDLLRELMQRKIEMDEHDFIRDNGVFYEYKDHYSTNYENGFVEYHIEEQPVYTRKHRQELLSSRTFNKEYTEPYYFTFGTDGTQPYKRGWMEVHASSYEDARELFRSKYKDKTKGILNCAGMYTKEQFHSQILPRYQESPEWCICHEILTKKGSTYPPREEGAKKPPLATQISSATVRREDGPSTQTPQRGPSL